MAHRPYPNVDRALRQVRRRHPVSEPEVARSLRAVFAQLRASAQRAAEQGFGLGDYQLSTRGPVVGGRR